MSTAGTPQIEEVKTLQASLIGDLTLCRWTTEKGSGYIYKLNVEQHRFDEESIKHMKVAEETYHPKIVGYSSTATIRQPYLDTITARQPEIKIEENEPKRIKLLFFEPFDESLKNEFLRRKQQGENYTEAEVWSVLFGVLKVVIESDRASRI